MNFAIPRRLFNGLVFGLLFGIIALGVSIVPGLFIQTVFISEVERCDHLVVFEEAAFDEVRTTCNEDLNEAPFWFPTLIIWTGASLGTIGGFAYGALRGSLFIRRS